ncbi:Polypyrimidine tract-binding protein like 2 [Dendrobium catenatum]|uniref:Polypyrimidine tract-binding protein like 2 n=1 Tax=Dendrobium catenatum TaxID=906689 RepID=A0A2I0VNB9_9ASPA|nr:Polypyrimidine tract-binding protein like 2 [Dendrobium catenatum]
MISYYSSSAEPAQVRGKTVYLQYSNRQEIVNNKSTGDVASNVLLVTIEGVQAHYVNIDVLHVLSLEFQKGLLESQVMCFVFACMTPWFPPWFHCICPLGFLPAAGFLCLGSFFVRPPWFRAVAASVPTAATSVSWLGMFFSFNLRVSFGNPAGSFHPSFSSPSEILRALSNLSSRASNLFRLSASATPPVSLFSNCGNFRVSSFCLQESFVLSGISPFPFSVSLRFFPNWFSFPWPVLVSLVAGSDPLCCPFASSLGCLSCGCFSRFSVWPFRVLFWNNLWPFISPYLIDSVGGGMVFSTFGFVHKIATFEKTAGFQALVQFSDSEIASTARSSLDGRSIPRYLLPEHVGVCTLRITFSAHTDLNVKFQSCRSRDYTNLNLPVAPSAIDVTGQSFQLHSNRPVQVSSIPEKSLINPSHPFWLQTLNRVIGEGLIDSKRSLIPYTLESYGLFVLKSYNSLSTLLIPSRCLVAANGKIKAKPKLGSSHLLELALEASSEIRVFWRTTRGQSKYSTVLKSSKSVDYIALEVRMKYPASKETEVGLPYVGAVAIRIGIEFRFKEEIMCVAVSRFISKSEINNDRGRDYSGRNTAISDSQPSILGPQPIPRLGYMSIPYPPTLQPAMSWSSGAAGPIVRPLSHPHGQIYMHQPVKMPPAVPSGMVQLPGPPMPPQQPYFH